MVQHYRDSCIGNRCTGVVDDADEQSGVLREQSRRYPEQYKDQ